MNNKQGVTESENGSGSSSLVNDIRLWNPRRLANLDSTSQMRTQQSTGQRSGYGCYDFQKQLELFHKYAINMKPIVVDSQQTLNQTTTSTIQDRILAEQRLMLQVQQSKQAQKLPVRSPIKYKLGMANKRLMQFMHLQRKRPDDNNIEFWEKMVAEFFTPDARKKYCVSRGQQHAGFRQQEGWQCELCKPNPGKAFGSNMKVLPRFFQIEYENGMLEKLLYIDDPKEHQNSVGQIIVDYRKATLENVYGQYRTVHDGYLRIVFSPEFKICSWEFCAWSQEELISRKSLIPQVNQLMVAIEQREAASALGHKASLSKLQSYCDVFVASAKQIIKVVDQPITTQLRNSGKNTNVLETVRVNDRMKHPKNYGLQNGTGSLESKFLGRTSTHSEQIQTQQQTMVKNSNNYQMQQVNPTDGVSTSWNQNQMSSMSSKPRYSITRTTDRQFSHTMSLPYNNEPQNSQNISFQQEKALFGTWDQDSMTDSEFSDLCSLFLNGDPQNLQNISFQQQQALSNTEAQDSTTDSEAFDPMPLLCNPECAFNDITSLFYNNDPQNRHNISLEQQALSDIRVQDSMVNNVTTERLDTTDDGLFDWQTIITPLGYNASPML